MNKALKRTALVAVLFFIIIFQSLNLISAAKKTEKTEFYKDQIEKAQFLLLQGNRKQSIDVLVQAINHENPKSISYQALVTALKTTVELFISEKAQQKFESAISIYPTNKQHALEVLNEALLIEPLNSNIMKGIAFVALGLKDCSLASRMREELFKLNRFDDELEKFLILETVCQKNKTIANSIFSKIDSSTANQQFWIINKFRALGVSTINNEQEFQFTNNADPELLYIKMTTLKRYIEKKKLADRYIFECRNIISYDKAFQWMDPLVCEHLKEVEEFHSSNEKNH